MFSRDQTEIECAKALASIAHYAYQVAYDPKQGIEEKMRILQWMTKKLPEINRMLIRIKTKQVGE